MEWFRAVLAESLSYLTGYQTTSGMMLSYTGFRIFPIKIKRTMGIDTFVARQLRKPSGLVGRFLVGKSLNQSNAPLEDMGLELMELEPDHRVLEIGFGNGRLISRMAEVVSDGTITGIDISPVMISQAQKQNIAHIRSGKVLLEKASVADIPAEDETFDKIFTANTIYFWPDPLSNIQEVRRTLKSGGQFYCGLRLSEDMMRMRVVRQNRQIFRNLYSQEEIMAFFESAGFSHVRCSIQERTHFSDVVVFGEK